MLECGGLFLVLLRARLLPCVTWLCEHIAAPGGTPIPVWFTTSGQGYGADAHAACDELGQLESVFVATLLSFCCAACATTLACRMRWMRMPPTRSWSGSWRTQRSCCGNRMVGAGDAAWCGCSPRQPTFAVGKPWHAVGQAACSCLPPAPCRPHALLATSIHPASDPMAALVQGETRAVGARLKDSLLAQTG